VQRDLDELWRFVLRRPVEPDERRAAQERLAAGMSYAALLQELAASSEFARIRALEESIAAGLTGKRLRDLELLPEIPWCLSRVPEGERVLDIGYALAPREYLDRLGELGDVTGAGLLVKEAPGVESVQADLRDLPFENDSFGVAIAISVLQRIGAEGDDSLHAGLAELRRVAKRVLVTVPAGERELPSEWIDRFTRAGFTVFEDELYELTSDGWRSVPELTPGLAPGSAVLCAELHHRTISERLRLAVRDRRHPNEIRRVT
jgi:hypothetical protein